MFTPPMDRTTPKAPPKLKPRLQPKPRRLVEEGYNENNEYVRVYDDGEVVYSQPELPANQLGLYELDEEPEVFDLSQPSHRGRREVGEDEEEGEGNPPKKIKMDESHTQPSLVDLAGTQAECLREEEKHDFERVCDGEIVEMESFLIPGECLKQDTSKNYLWKFGRADGQFRVVLGHNTIFKVTLTIYIL